MNNKIKIFSITLIVFSMMVLLSGAIIIKAFDKEKINILLYGVDGRKNEDVSERSDAIILINVNFKESEIVATSIPRDSYVKITCRNNEYDKINHAYAYGNEECLNETVSQLFGINKLHNVMLNFKDVVELIDYFGLIELIPMYTFCQSDENLENKYCFEKNKKILIDGKQALAYMRNRKSLPNGDLDRIKNQRQIIKIIMEKFLKLSVIEKIKYYNYAKKIIKTDISLNDLNIKEIISGKQIDLKEYTLKGEDYIDTYYYYKLDKEYLENVKKYYI